MNPIELLLGRLMELEQKVENLSLNPLQPTHNLAATVAPTATDDSRLGYGKGSVWVTTTAIYVCRSSSAGAAVWDNVTAGGGGGGPMPLISPATANNLALQNIDGSLSDAGYGVSQSTAVAGSVPRRDASGTLINTIATGANAIFGQATIGGTGVVGASDTGAGVLGSSNSGTGLTGASNSGTGALSNTISGAYHHAFGSVSAIARASGILAFLGASAATNRTAQLTELGGTTVGRSMFTSANPSAIRFARANADNSFSWLTAADFRTAIGANTVGANIYTATNPSAVTFLRVNADNTVSFLTATQMRTAISAMPLVSPAVAGNLVVLDADGSLSDAGYVPTTVGRNVLTAANPSAATFIRVNADNSVSFLTSAQMQTALDYVTVGTTQTITATKTWNALQTFLAGIRIGNNGTANLGIQISVPGVNWDLATGTLGNLSVKNGAGEYLTFITASIISQFFGLVGMGTASPSGRLHVIPTAAGQKGLVVQGVAAQTGNLQDWQDSSGTVLSSIDAGGLPSWATTTTLMFHADSSTSVTLTNQTSAAEFLSGSNRNIFKLDLAKHRQVRITARVNTASASVNSPRLIARYKTVASGFSTTVGDYVDIGTGEVASSLSALGVISSAWIDLAAAAKADVFIAVVQAGGNALDDPRYGMLGVEFR